MPVRQPNTVTPLKGGPFYGNPAGLNYETIPCVAETIVDAGATYIELSLPKLIEWWGSPLTQQIFSFVADAGGTGNISALVAGLGPYKIYLNNAQAAGPDIAAGDFIFLAYDQDLDAGNGGLHMLNWSQLGGGPSQGTTQIVTGAGTVTVLATDTLIAIKKAAPSATPINLPDVASRGGHGVQITDFSDNGGPITITPAVGETIMGSASIVLNSNGTGPLGTGGAITLYPNTDLDGWYIAP